MVGRRKEVCSGEEEKSVVGGGKECMVGRRKGVYGGKEKRSVCGREKGELKHECVEERTLVHSGVMLHCVTAYM